MSTMHTKTRIFDDFNRSYLFYNDFLKDYKIKETELMGITDEFERNKAIPDFRLVEKNLHDSEVQLFSCACTMMDFITYSFDLYCQTYQRDYSLPEISMNRINDFLIPYEHVIVRDNAPMYRSLDNYYMYSKLCRKHSIDFFEHSLARFLDDMRTSFGGDFADGFLDEIEIMQYTIESFDKATNLLSGEPKYDHKIETNELLFKRESNSMEEVEDEEEEEDEEVNIIENRKVVTVNLGSELGKIRRRIREVLEDYEKNYRATTPPLKSYK